MEPTYAYAATITKSVRDENGDLIVYGKAAGPDLDLDEQICDPGWLKSAMPDWMVWGNVREMHRPVAAGVGVELEASGDDWNLKSKCIDPGTAAKIEAGVLKGYSVGIKAPQVVKDAAAPGGRIVGGTIVEVSYVDRPCNPTAKMAIAKMAGDGGDLEPVEATDDEPAADEAGTGEAADTSAADEPAADAPDVDKAAEGDAANRKLGTAELAKVSGALGVILEQLAAGPMDRATMRKMAGMAGVEGELAALLPDDVKASPAQDITDAQGAIAAIARLIQSEADGLAAGDLCETEHIDNLLRAIRALKWFIWGEEAEIADATMDAVSDALSTVDVVELTASADLTKNAPQEPATEPADGGDAEATDATDDGGEPEDDTAPKYVTRDEIASLVKTAVAEAQQGSGERIKALETDLAKAKADLTKALDLPAPGGPVLTRTHEQHAAARKSDADLLRDQADALLKQAQAASTEDRTLAAGYRQRAAELLAKADA